MLENFSSLFVAVEDAHEVVFVLIAGVSSIGFLVIYESHQHRFAITITEVEPPAILKHAPPDFRAGKARLLFGCDIIMKIQSSTLLGRGHL